MKRGDIVYADLSPTVGSEINKRRPVLIVSNNANNRAASTLTVLPMTSSMTRIYPFEVALSRADPGLPKDSKAQAQQIRTISRYRIQSKPVGRLTTAKLQEIDAAIRLHLAL